LIDNNFNDEPTTAFQQFGHPIQKADRLKSRQKKAGPMSMDPPLAGTSGVWAGEA
jgi:hypothetical protein